MEINFFVPMYNTTFFSFLQEVITIFLIFFYVFIGNYVVYEHLREFVGIVLLGTLGGDHSVVLG